MKPTIPALSHAAPVRMVIKDRQREDRATVS